MDHVHKIFKIVLLVANIILFVSMLLLKSDDLLCLQEDISPFYIIDTDSHATYPIGQIVEDISRTISQSQPNILMNITNFEYLLNNETVCPQKEDNWKILLIIVPSARENLIGRNSIRKSWGSVKSYKNWKVRTIFLLGIKENEKDYNLSQESEKHGDIVLGNFVDSYKLMTFKHTLAYKWTLESCPQVDYMFKVDDDVFVDLFTVVDILNENEGIDLICPILHERKVERNVTNKWHVTEEEYSSPVYPPYCLGAGYLISVKWLDKIYLAASKMSFFWIDDIFITGIAREYAQIRAKEKMSLLSLELFTQVLIDVDPDIVVKNYINFANSNNTNSAQFPAIYATIKRKAKFDIAMQYLWEHVLRVAIESEQ